MKITKMRYYHRCNKNNKTDTRLIFYSKIVIQVNPYETLTDGLKYNILIQGVFTVFIINVKVKPHCIIHHEKKWLGLFFLCAFKQLLALHSKIFLSFVSNHLGVVKRIYTLLPIWRLSSIKNFNSFCLIVSQI